MKLAERLRTDVADAAFFAAHSKRVPDVRWGESKILEKLSAQAEIKICPTRLRGRFDGLKLVLVLLSVRFAKRCLTLRDAATS